MTEPRAEPRAEQEGVTRNRSTSPELIAQAPAEPKPGPEHKRLDAFVGKWNVEGKNKEGAPVAAGAKVTAVQTYEWMPGGFFLVHREFARFGDVEHKTMTIIGYDPSSQTYPVHFFDNLGYYRVYQARVHDRTWTFTGQYERATIVFGADGNTFKSTWERSSDGSNWLPLCELKGTKAR
jgi:hypothetical protein